MSDKGALLVPKGSPGVRRYRTPVEVRFWPWVERRSYDECWPWTGHLGTSGYGEFGLSEGQLEQVKTGVHGAHRVAFRLIHGYWPESSLHGCDFKLCCNAENPEHIHDGTLELNNQEMFERSRARPRGKVPLTPGQCAEIYALYRAGGIRQVDLAAQFGVTQVRVSQVLQAAGIGPGRGGRRGHDGRFA